MCPFNRTRCGSSNAFSFDNLNQSQSINITLAGGETCTYLIEAKCGIPAFTPNDTAGFDIETVDYDDDDLNPAGSSNSTTTTTNSTTGKRFLQRKDDDEKKDDKREDKKDERKNFTSDKKPPQPKRNVTIQRVDKKDKSDDKYEDKQNETKKNETKKDESKQNETAREAAKQQAEKAREDAKKQRGPQAARYNPNVDGASKKFKDGAKFDDKEELCSKKRYQQLSITAIGNLGTNTTARLLQTAANTQQLYTMSVTVGSSDFNADTGSSTSSATKFFCSAALVVMTTLMTIFI